MVKKYNHKKEIFNQCIDSRQSRDNELIDWKDRLVNMRDRIQMIEGQLNILGVNEDHEGVEVFRKFLSEIERLRQNSNNLEQSISKFAERINDESSDLEMMEMKIVKTAKLDGILKALQQIGLMIEGYEKELEKFDLVQK